MGGHCFMLGIDTSEARCVAVNTEWNSIRAAGERCWAWCAGVEGSCVSWWLGCEWTLLHSAFMKCLHGAASWLC